MLHPTLTRLDHLTLEATWDHAKRRRLQGEGTDAENAPADASSTATPLTSQQVERVRLRHEAGESLNSLARELHTTCDSLLQLVVRRW